MLPQVRRPGPAMPGRHDDVVRGFADACRRGDIPALRAALSLAAVAVVDSGGSVPAPAGPVAGAGQVLDLVGVLLCGQADTELTVEAVNGRAGLALRRAGRVVAIVGLTVADAQVVVLWIVLNPAKLAGWQHDG
jgi:RNA polymerase sigma-70 factor (ECF subfamily)